MKHKCNTVILSAGHVIPGHGLRCRGAVVLGRDADRDADHRILLLCYDRRRLCYYVRTAYVIAPGFCNDTPPSPHCVRLYPTSIMLWMRNMTQLCYSFLPAHYVNKHCVIRPCVIPPCVIPPSPRVIQRRPQLVLPSGPTQERWSRRLPPPRAPEPPAAIMLSTDI